MWREKDASLSRVQRQIQNYTWWNDENKSAQTSLHVIQKTHTSIHKAAQPTWTHHQAYSSTEEAWQNQWCNWQGWVHHGYTHWQPIGLAPAAAIVEAAMPLRPWPCSDAEIEQLYWMPSWRGRDTERRNCLSVAMLFPLIERGGGGGSRRSEVICSLRLSLCSRYWKFLVSRCPCDEFMRCDVPSSRLLFFSFIFCRPSLVARLSVLHAIL